ncbi:MAG: radical SAM protein [Proteobacteria bacterium]|nr:radical SAM protein [Pseudomonadota bacterium]
MTTASHPEKKVPGLLALDPLSPCRVCPRNCGVDRRAGEKGFCGLDDRIHLAWAGRHHGEEPCFSGTGGVANLFFTSCNLACVYCQNHQISQGGVGGVVSAGEFADLALSLEGQGAHFLGLVTPSPQVFAIAPALELARARGLSLPVICNTSAYDSPEALRRLDGLVDVYLPDVKYADDALSLRYSNAPGYVEASRAAILEMHRQVGDMVLDPETGLARRGLWVRHLVLPGGAAGTWENLCFLALEVSPRLGLSIMAQYAPLHRAGLFPEIARPVTAREYEEAVTMARDLGFAHILVQDLESSPENAVPDFTDKERPFTNF